MIKKAIIIVFALFPSLFLYSQNDVRGHTLAIIDTLDTEYNQARDIYNWITSNIKYDLKKYVKRESTPIPPVELIKKRKGVCSDIADLYKEMCSSVGIEAYRINGYSKGYNYYPGMPLLSGNHSWNVIKVDTTWIVCDATWGSGKLTVKPDFFQRALYVTLRKPFTNNKLSFESNSNNYYFDVSQNRITDSHYPLDNKWLLSKTPVSFGYFIGDSVQKYDDNPYFIESIKEIRGKSYEHQYKVEGIAANKKNPLNYFNLADGYYQVNMGNDLEREITTNNLWQFENYYEEYSIIFSSITRHKTITDSVYRSRFNSLNKLASDQKRITNKIKSKTKSAKNSFKSKQSQITGKSSSYEKKIGGYLINIGRAELKYIQQPALAASSSNDSIELESIKNEVSRLEELEYGLNFTLDSLNKFIDARISQDAYLDDSIMAKNTLFNAEIISLKHMILSNDEFIIRKYVDSLKIVYSDIVLFLNDKKNSKKEIEGIGRQFFAVSGELQKNLKKQTVLLNKAVKISNYDAELISKNNLAVKRLIKSYNRSIEFTKKLSRHNSAQKDIRKQNLEALKEQRKSIKTEYKFFSAWYAHIYKQAKADHENEKLVTKSIRSDSQRKLKLVEMKIKKYNTALEKKSKADSN